MKIVISLLAMVSILFGLVSMVTPIPGGSILIAGGLTALICSSPSAQFCLMWLRSRFNWINKLVFFLERKIGTRISIVGKALAKTQPNPVGKRVSHREFVALMTKHK